MAKKIIATENVYRDYKKIFKYCFIVFIALIFLCINYCTLEDLLGSNHSYINDFQKPETQDLSIKEPAVAGLFYSSDKKLLDENVSHYIKENSSSKTKPSIIIVPSNSSEYSGEISGRAYSILKPYSKKIRRVFIIGPSRQQDFEGIAMSSKDFFKTSRGNVPVDMNLVKEIVDKNQRAKFFETAYDKEIFIRDQLPFLQKNLKSFKIVPIAYGEIDSLELSNILEPYLLREDTLIIFSADLSKYYKKQNLDKDTGIKSALILANRNDLFSKTINLKNSGDIIGNKEFDNSFNDNEDKESRGIEAQVESLKNFADLYKKELISIVNISLEDAVSSDSIYKPSRDEYSNQMFDKGASFVTIIKNKELRGEAGTIIPRVSIAQDIANSAYESAMNDKRFSKLEESELKDIDFSISLLTKIERIRYLDEKNLISKIQKGFDGLVIVDGNRQGLLLPNFWRKTSNSEDFLKELKLRAGISPAYWSNKIKIYRFRTVEVFKNEY